MAGTSPALLIRTIDTMTDWSGKIVAWSCVPLIVANTYEVVSRYGFNAPTDWASEVTMFAYGSMFMLGAAYALLKGAHIRTDMLWEKFSNVTKGRIDLVAYLVFFYPSMLAIFYFTGIRFLESFAINERSATTAWQPLIWPFRGAIPLTALLLMIQGISEVLKVWHMARTGEELVHHEKIEI
jgi:TRAP-type mannitol/chloroaromatic compound transport system permease small subunit